MSTSYSIGEMNQLAGALEKAGYTSEDVTKLRKFGRLADFRRLINGDLELVEKQVPNIDPEAFYDILGMSQEYKRFCSRFDMSEQPGIWKLPMLKGLTYDKIVMAYEHADIKLETFGVSLQKRIDPKKEQRCPNRYGDYLVCFKRNLEADEENINQSANERLERNCQDNTLAERLLLGEALYLPTSVYLDSRIRTLCTGSRFDSVLVPLVGWDADNDWVGVSLYAPDNRDGGLRPRSVEVLKPKSA